VVWKIKGQRERERRKEEAVKSNVKMKREETAMIIASMDGKKSLYHWYYHFLNNILSKVQFGDPNREKMIEYLTKAREIVEDGVGSQQPLMAKL